MHSVCRPACATWREGCPGILRAVPGQALGSQESAKRGHRRSVCSENSWRFLRNDRCRTMETRSQFPRMVARGGQPKPPPRRWRRRWAIAQAALHLGERLLGRSSRNGSGVVIAKNAGQPAVRRPPCASQLCALCATRTGLSGRAVVARGYGDDSRPCPIPRSIPETHG